MSAFTPGEYGDTILVAADMIPKLDELRGVMADLAARTFTALVKDGATSMRNLRIWDFPCPEEDGRGVCASVARGTHHLHLAWKATIE